MYAQRPAIPKLKVCVPCKKKFLGKDGKTYIKTVLIDCDLDSVDVLLKCQPPTCFQQFTDVLLDVVLQADERESLLSAYITVVHVSCQCRLHHLLS